MDSQPAYLPYLLAIGIPVFFVGMWIGVTSLMGALSGWYRLAQQYPNRDERPLLQLNWQSGVMGSIVNLRGALKVGACNSGLRFGIVRLLGPFSHDFFVPWSQIKITRQQWMFGSMAELEFGHPPIGKIVIYSSTADRLAQAAGKNWPEQATAAVQQRR